jgi:hypothetical protein
MSEFTITSYSSHACSSAHAEITDPNLATLLNNDLLVASTSIKNPMEMTGSAKLNRDRPDLNYALALSYALKSKGFSDADIFAITKVSIDDTFDNTSLQDMDIDEDSPTPSGSKHLLITCYLSMTELRSLFTTFLKSRLKELEQDKSLLRLPNENPKVLPPGCIGLVERQADYWLYLMLLIIKIRNCEFVNDLTFPANAKEIASILGTNRARLLKVIDQSLQWPYFLQLLTHLYGPTIFNCRDAHHVEEQGYHYLPGPSKHYVVSENPSEHVPAVILPLVSIDTVKLLDKLGDLKSTLSLADRALPPKIPPLSRLLCCKPNSKMIEERESFEKKRRIFNQSKTLSLIKENLRKEKSKLTMLVDPLMPLKINRGFLPIPRNLSIELGKRHGFTLPSWLTTPNLREPHAIAILDHLYTRVAPPYQAIVTHTPLFSINRDKDLNDIQQSIKRLLPYESDLPDLPDYCRHYHSASHGLISHLAPTYRNPLNMKNMQELFAIFLRYDTYKAQNTVQNPNF